MERAYKTDGQGRRYLELDEQQKEIIMAPFPGFVGLSIDMSDADLLRKKLQKETDIHVTTTVLIVKAAASAVEDFPLIAGVWLSTDKIWVPNPGEITVWVPTQIGDQTGGFAIERASKKDLLEISNEISTQANEIRSKGEKAMAERPIIPAPKLCITNMGMIGPVETGAVVPLGPHVSGGMVAGVLGIFAVLEKPGVKDGRIRVRKMMDVVLLFDHAAMMANSPIEFLTQLKRNLEEPDTYLI
jgi:pyruvate dehydrogenase E2 component (dihydrolipoamide acetyltransferase)